MGDMAFQITSLAIVYSSIYSDTDQGVKTPKLCVTGLCAGNSPMTGEFSTQMASNVETPHIHWHKSAQLKPSFMPYWENEMLAYGTSLYENSVVDGWSY